MDRRIRKKPPSQPFPAHRTRGRVLPDDFAPLRAADADERHADARRAQGHSPGGGQVLHMMVMPDSTVPYTGHSPTQLSIQPHVTASPSQVLGTHSWRTAPPAMIRQISPVAHISEPGLQVTVSPQAPVSTNQVPWVHCAMLRPGPSQSS